MPITQDRMIALVNAGLDCKQALERAVELVKLGLTAIRDGEDATRQMEELTMLVTVAGLLNSAQSLATLLIEQHHFKRARRGNTKRRDTLRARRHEAGVPTASTAPDTLLSGRPLAKTSGAERLRQRDGNLNRLKFTGLSAAQKASLEAEAERDFAAELLLHDGAMHSTATASPFPVETSFIPEDNDDAELTLEGIAGTGTAATDDEGETK